MTQVMQSHIVEASIFPGPAPGVGKVPIRHTAFHTGNHKRPDVRSVAQNLDCSIAQMDRSRLVCLAVRQPDKAPLPVNVIPLDRGNLARTGTGK